MPKKTVYVSNETLKDFARLKRKMILLTELSGEDWITNKTSNSYIFAEGVHLIEEEIEAELELLARDKGITIEELYSKANTKLALKESNND